MEVVGSVDKAMIGVIEIVPVVSYPNIYERLRLYDIFRVVSLQSHLCDILHVHGNVYNSVHDNIRGKVCSNVHGDIRSVYVRILRLKPGALQV
jgi:hypothetical protein